MSVNVYGASTTTTPTGMTLIQETVASSNTSIDFLSIPSTYKHLMLIWEGVYFSGTGVPFSIRFNSDSGTNYYPNWYYTEIGSVSQISTARTDINDSAIGVHTTDTTLLNTNKGILHIYNYSGNKLKQYHLDSYYYSSSNGRNNRNNTKGIWNNTSAITSLNIFGNGSTTLSNLTSTSIRLYGVS